MRRWGLWEVIGHEGGALTDGIGVLMKETPEGSLTLRGHGDKSPSTRQEGALTRPSMRQRLDLRIPSLQNCEKLISVVYKPLGLGYSVRAAPIRVESQLRKCQNQARKLIPKILSL